MATCFLVCEFTDLLHPELLSIGLVELAGAEHYRRTDLDTEIGKARMRASSQFVRWSGVLDPWRLVEGATATQWEMGRRTGDWLLQLANMSGTRVEVCYDYDLDFEAMAHAARDSSPWDKVRDVVLPTNINRLTGTIDGELAGEECFRGLATRRLQRHRAPADALALRAAYVVVKSSAMELARFARTDDFQRLVNAAGELEWESWTRQWLLKAGSRTRPSPCRRSRWGCTSRGAPGTNRQRLRPCSQLDMHSRLIVLRGSSLLPGHRQRPRFT